MSILVTRPKGKGESLVRQLKTLGRQVHYQPIIDIAPGPDLALLPNALIEQNIDMLIFVSTFAADNFIAQVKDPHILKKHCSNVLAVGRTTAKRIEDWADISVEAPTLETSEGLLDLPILQKQQVAGKKIVIVRGVGGRELLYERLKSNQAKVEYWQLYQRVVIDSEQQSWYDLWQKQQIDCIIVTSVAIFDAIVDTLPESAVPWLRSVHWVVASDRIGDNARQFGICCSQITNAQGATDEKLIAAVKQITET